MPLDKLRTLIQDAQHKRGRWRLTRDHEIEYRRDGLNEEWSVAGPVVAVEAGKLLFSVTEKASDQKTVTRLVGLSGVWSAGRDGSLRFDVEKKSGPSDALFFRAAWKLNDRYQIVYAVTQTALKTRHKIQKELVFSGEWKLETDRILAFWIGGDSASALRFRGAFQTESVRARKGAIRFQLGAEFSRARRTRALVFFGKWKLSRTMGLSFELEGASGKKPVWHFGSVWSIAQNGEMSADLVVPGGSRLGMEVVFTRKLFKDREIFVRLKHLVEESRLEGGLRGRF